MKQPCTTAWRGYYAKGRCINCPEHYADCDMRNK